MKLVTSLTSPYGRKVRVVLLEKKIPFQLQVENPWLPDSPVAGPARTGWSRAGNKAIMAAPASMSNN